MSRVDLIPTAQAAQGRDVSQTCVAVIDVFRATTSIGAALEAGAQAIVPVAELDQARALKRRAPGAVLAGERGSVPPPDFDMGNSPVAFSAARLQGAQVILTTTNGTLAVANAAGATGIFAVSLRNARQAARTLADQRGSVTLLCAGTEGAFSLDDFYAAGVVARGLAGSGWALSDSAWAAALLAERPVDEVVNRSTCRHYGRLLERGFDDDVSYALTPDSSRLVPVYDGHAFVRP